MYTVENLPRPTAETTSYWDSGSTALLGDVMDGGGEEEVCATRGDAEAVGRGEDEDAAAFASDDAKESALGSIV